MLVYPPPSVDVAAILGDGVDKFIKGGKEGEGANLLLRWGQQ